MHLEKRQKPRVYRTQRAGWKNKFKITWRHLWTTPSDTTNSPSLNSIVDNLQFEHHFSQLKIYELRQNSTQNTWWKFFNTSFSLTHILSFVCLTCWASVSLEISFDTAQKQIQYWQTFWRFFISFFFWLKISTIKRSFTFQTIQPIS